MSDMQTLDWKKLEQFIAERQPVKVSAGILNDWFWTAATVYENGEWKDHSRAWVTSSWANPGFKATMPNGDVVEVSASASIPETDAQAEQRRAESKKTREELKRLAAKLEAERSERDAARELNQEGK